MSRTVLALLLALTTFARAQVTGRVSGSVIDSSGAFVPKATVNLSLHGGKRPLLTTSTNTQGLFSIETIRPECVVEDQPRNEGGQAPGRQVLSEDLPT